eukprot:COSAG06_NODE_24113_length_672_cov_1.197208_1_plen_41_part_01
MLKLLDLVYASCAYLNARALVVGMSLIIEGEVAFAVLSMRR